VRVAVTTTEDRFDGVAASLLEHGLQPVPLPCISVRPERDDVLASVRDAISSIGGVMVSSARAVEVLWPEGEKVAADFYVVGPATAAAVERRRGTVRIEGAAGLAELARVLVPFGLRRLVFPHAGGTDLESLEPLASAGVDVLSSVVYHTDRCPPGDEEVDAVAFASPSAVEGWLSSRPLDGLVVAAIGPTTAAALTRRGIDVDVVPPRPGHADLAAQLAAFSNQNGRIR
jgi:uroporphyrinogen-III synthase/uroporphyrinogen III methyltransferase/synthase